MAGTPASSPAGRRCPSKPGLPARFGPLATLCLLGPIVTVLVLRLPLINQLEYADAWFYSGYAWVPKHLFAVNDWNYFSVRFPAILSIGAFDRVFGAHAGYVILRYVLAAACGLALYLGVRRFATAGAAAGAVALLYLNPFFSRMLLWDYAGFVVVAAGVIGVALWYFSEDRRWWWTLLAGAALATGIFASVLLATAVLVLFAVELVAAARGGRPALLKLVWRAGLCLLGAILVFGVGYVGYLRIIGHLSPLDIVRPTIEFLGENTENSAPYQHKVSEWLLHMPHLLAPILLSLALLAVMGRRALGSDIAARVTQALVAYTVFLWVYRFVLTSSLIETWWAFDVIVVFMAPGFGVLLAALGEQRATWRGRTALVVGIAAVTCVVVRDVHGPIDDMYRWMTSNAGAVVALLVLGVALVLAMRARGSATRLAAVAALVLVIEVAAYAPNVLDGRGGTGAFALNASRDWRGYGAGKQLALLIRAHEGQGRQVYLWYRGTSGLANIVWVDLPQYGQTVNQVGVDDPMTVLRPLGIARLAQKQLTYVLVLSADPRDMGRALSTLRAKGFDGPIVKRGSFADGGLSYELIVIRRRPV